MEVVRKRLRFGAGRRVFELNTLGVFMIVRNSVICAVCGDLSLGSSTFLRFPAVPPAVEFDEEVFFGNRFGGYTGVTQLICKRLWTYVVPRLFFCVIKTSLS